MRIELTNPEQLPDLVAFLEARVNLVVQRLNDRQLAVGVLGSYRDGGARELEEYLDEWNRAQSGRASARLVRESLRSILKEPPSE
jgi:hypothetical protein